MSAPILALRRIRTCFPPFLQEIVRGNFTLVYELLDGRCLAPCLLPLVLHASRAQKSWTTVTPKTAPLTC